MVQSSLDLSRQAAFASRALWRFGCSLESSSQLQLRCSIELPFHRLWVFQQRLLIKTNTGKTLFIWPLGMGALSGGISPNQSPFPSLALLHGLRKNVQTNVSLAWQSESTLNNKLSNRNSAETEVWNQRPSFRIILHLPGHCSPLLCWDLQWHGALRIHLDSSQLWQPKEGVNSTRSSPLHQLCTHFAMLEVTWRDLRQWAIGQK